MFITREVSWFEYSNWNDDI